MDHIWECDCGHDWKCEASDFRPGAVVECPSCKTIWGALMPRSGYGPKWLKLDREIATSPYYDFLTENANDEDDAALVTTPSKL